MTLNAKETKKQTISLLKSGIGIPVNQKRLPLEKIFSMETKAAVLARYMLQRREFQKRKRSFKKCVVLLGLTVVRDVVRCDSGPLLS